ncbi:hypothetical protein NP493_354g03011 [Ridgeia piscesae]|uniref:Sialate O-acetylesterase n=1 Tax=Ridgeia piscesae TaxID=27915 RepID=A0AAD9L325_RIDPI|nr:hypothetical protein NP493_354g03011 [Ridgeia piscesae]
MSLYMSPLLRTVALIFFTFACGLRLVCGDDTLRFKPKGEHDSTLRFASYYADHMVLQKAPQRATVWGYASADDIGSYVTVQLISGRDLTVVSTHQATIKADIQSGGGVWVVKLTATPPGGPYVVKATVEAQSIEMKDVLFGDVWLCGGQSNMQFGLEYIFNASEELASAKNYPHIRLFDTKMIASPVPLADLQAITLQWSLPSNASLAGGWTYFSAMCWLYGKQLHETLGYPIGLVESCWGGTPVEAWSSPDALRQCGLKQSDLEKQLTSESNKRELMKMDPVFGYMGPQQSSQLWNAMIHPLLNMTIYGAIWYQGEANGGRPDTYNCTFPSMIDDWRKNFYFGSGFETSSLFPFGFVQIGPNGPDGSKIIRGFPDIRWHQTADVGYVPNPRMKNVFMATAVDDTDFSSPHGPIHPRDKTTISKRLAVAGLTVAYGMDRGQFQGPFPSSYEISRTQATLTLMYDFNRFKIQQRSSSGFEVCCSRDTVTLCPVDGNWTAAPVVNVGVTTVQLSWRACGADTYVMGLRYEWRLTPCAYKKCAIYSVENELPAPPFIFQRFFGLGDNATNNL